MRLHSLPLLAVAALVACDSAPSEGPDATDTDTQDQDADADASADDTDASADDTDAPVDDGPFTLVTVDATSHTDWAHLDLATGQVLPLTHAAATSSTDWHLKFRRFHVRSNGGSSGPGSVGVSLVVDNAHLYDEDGAPIADAFAALDDAEEADRLLEELPSPEQGRSNVSDRLVNAFGNSWYSYNFATGVASENPHNGWIVRGADGLTHARVRVTELDFPTRLGNGIQSFTATVEVQPDGEAGFNEPVSFTGSIGAGGGTLCFSFDDESTTSCNGTGWDLALGFEGRTFLLKSNSGDAGPGAGGAYGPVAWSTLSTFADALTHPEDGDISGDFQDDRSESLFDQHTWYGYGVAGPHRLSPNYRIYVIDPNPADDTTPRFALQVTDYYDAAGTSGHIALRWVTLPSLAEIEADADLPE